MPKIFATREKPSEHGLADPEFEPGTFSFGGRCPNHSATQNLKKFFPRLMIFLTVVVYEISILLLEKKHVYKITIPKGYIYLVPLSYRLESQLLSGHYAFSLFRFSSQLSLKYAS